MRGITKLCWLLLLSICFTNAYSQEEYQPLKPKGTIPKDFLLLSSQKVAADVDALNNDDQRSVRKVKENFLLESNFRIDNLLTSGKVLFNDDVTAYVNQVADLLLKDDPELRKKLRFYTVKTPYVNAFATNQGIIFVNLGLIGQLENEAQLAFVLAHEIIHYKNQHVINAAVEDAKINRDLSRNKIDDGLLAKSTFSKELELEADMEGLKIFAKSNYTLDAVNDVFFALQFSHLPFDEVPLDRTFVETNNIKLPETYYLEKLEEIEPNDLDDDRYSSHPNVDGRKRKLEDDIEKLKREDNDKEFIISKEKFFEVRKICRYEMTRYFIQSRNYSRALYNSFLLLKENPNDKFAAKCHIKALTFLTRYSNEGDFYDVFEDYEDVQGEAQQLCHVYYKMDRDQINTLAVVKAWEYLQKYPEDEVFSYYLNELLYELIKNHQEDLNYYKAKRPQEKEEVSDDNKKKSKYDKIKEKLNTGDEDSSSLSYAFIDFVEDKDFTSRFYNAKERLEKENNKKKLSKKEQADKERKIDNMGLSLGIDEIFILDPTYVRVKFGDNPKRLYESSERAQQIYLDVIDKSAQTAGLKTRVLSPSRMTENDAMNWADYSLLQEWVSERFEHGKLDYLPSNSEYIKQISERTGVRYVAVTGIFGGFSRMTAAGCYAGACYSILSYGIYLPFFIYNALTPKYEFFYYFYLINLQTGIAKLVDSRLYNEKDKNYLLKSVLYHNFNQIKR